MRSCNFSSTPLLIPKPRSVGAPKNRSEAPGIVSDLCFSTPTIWFMVSLRLSQGSSEKMRAAAELSEPLRKLNPVMDAALWTPGIDFAIRTILPTMLSVTSRDVPGDMATLPITVPLSSCGTKPVGRILETTPSRSTKVATMPRATQRRLGFPR